MIVGEEVLVVTKTGTAFRGILRARRGRWVRVTGNVAVVENGEKHELAGDVFIPRENVNFVQRTGGNP